MILRITDPQVLWRIMRAIAHYNDGHLSFPELLVAIEMQGYTCDGHNLLSSKRVAATMMRLEENALIVDLSTLADEQQRYLF
jgi:hypothetical protein